jgi:Holliday junction resolvase RusA-like endonuclease
MSSCKIIIPFTPKPKASVELSRGRWFNPSARGMKQVAEYVKKAFKDRALPLLKGPLLVIVHFVLPAPLSLPERKRRVQNFLPHAKRPDGDNLEKFLNDALTGVMWADDGCIPWLLRSKSITSARNGFTIFYAKEINNEPPDYEGLLETIRENIYINQGEQNESTERPLFSVANDGDNGLARTH